MRAGDLRAYHRESRGFHFALLAPARMRRFVGMVESAWNLTESYRPMALLSDADRQRLHADHGEMLAAFVARDAAVLAVLRGDPPPAAARRRRGLPPGDAFADEPTGQRDENAPCPSRESAACAIRRTDASAVDIYVESCLPRAMTA